MDTSRDHKKAPRWWALVAPLAIFFALLAGPASAFATEYIVFVDDGVDPAVVARSAGASIDYEFTTVANGFSSNLDASQIALLSSDSRVASMREDQPFALAQFGTEDYETGALVTDAFRRGDLETDAFRRGTLEDDAFRRGAIGEDAFRRGAFRRGEFDADAFRRGAFRRGAFRRGAFRRGAFRRGSINSPYVRQIPSTGINRIGANGWANNVNADIAILDSGIDRWHPDLNVAYAGSCVPGENGADLSGHGTMVAGLAAARNNRYGVVGSAPGARIWSVKVSDETGTIMESAALCGLEWVLNNSRRIEVANISWSGNSTSLGTSCDSLTLPTAQRTRGWHRSRVVDPNQREAAGAPGNDVDPASIDALHGMLCGIENAGVTVVAAAGNDAQDTSAVLPAAWPEVIAVSSMSDTDGKPGGLGGPGCLTGDADDTLSSFTNFGAPIDIAAPGECLLSTDIRGGYAYGSGTSFATPLVAGVAAVYASRDRNATPESIRAQLLATAEAGPIQGDTDGYGEGVLHASR